MEVNIDKYIKEEIANIEHTHEDWDEYITRRKQLGRILVSKGLTELARYYNLPIPETTKGKRKKLDEVLENLSKQQEVCNGRES